MKNECVLNGIHCEAKNCIHNNGHCCCTADHIQVSSDALHPQECVCETFREA